MRTENDLTIQGRIETKEYESSALPDEWDSMSDAEKLEAIRGVDPVASETTYNTTTTEMHEYFAINLDPDQTLDQATTHLAVGDNDTTPEVTNTELNNEVFRKEVTDHTQTGNELLVSTFIEATEANGNTFRELGLFAGPDPSDRLWNHSTIGSIAKDSTRTITIDVTLTFNAV